MATLKPSPSPPTTCFLLQLHVLEDDVGGVRGPLAHLVLLLAHRHPGRLAVDHEAGDALVALGPLQAGEHGVEVGHAAVGDPALLSGQHEIVAHLAVAALHAGHVRPGVRLGAAVGGEDRGGQQPAEVLLLLLVGAGDDERHGPQRVARHGGVDPHAAVGDLLHQQAVVQAGQPQPAELGGQLAVHQAGLPGPLADLVRELALFVEVPGDRDDLLPGEVPGGLDQLLLLFGEVEADHGRRILQRFVGRRWTLPPWRCSVSPALSLSVAPALGPPCAGPALRPAWPRGRTPPGWRARPR